MFFIFLDIFSLSMYVCVFMWKINNTTQNDNLQDCIQISVFVTFQTFASSLTFQYFFSRCNASLFLVFHPHTVSALVEIFRAPNSRYIRIPRSDRGRVISCSYADREKTLNSLLFKALSFFDRKSVPDYAYAKSVSQAWSECWLSLVLLITIASLVYSSVTHGVSFPVGIFRWNLFAQRLTSRRRRQEIMPIRLTSHNERLHFVGITDAGLA